MTAKQRAERIVPMPEPVDPMPRVTSEFAQRVETRNKLVKAITKLLTDDRKAVAAFIRRQNAMVNELLGGIDCAGGVHDAFVNDICKRIENPSLPLE